MSSGENSSEENRVNQIEGESPHTSEDTGAESDRDAPSVPPDPEARIAELESQVLDIRDQLLRKAADFDNYRKRMIREKQEAIDYANASLLGDLLDSIDNLDRALEASKTAAAINVVVDGVTMVKTQLVSMLENKYNLICYGARGDLFDPTAHEGIASIPGEVSEATVGDVYLKGYKLKERVIRHAKVQVVMPAPTMATGNSD